VFSDGVVRKGCPTEVDVRWDRDFRNNPSIHLLHFRVARQKNVAKNNKSTGELSSVPSKVDTCKTKI
jgi:hypothetical protein